MKKTLIAAVSVTALLLTSSAASAQFCVVGIMAAAAHASWRDNRELTQQEAASCGLTYLFATPRANKPKKRVVRRTRRR